MSGPGTKLAERELEEEAGSARVPRERARPTAAQSLLRAGGGGAGFDSHHGHHSVSVI